MAKVLVLHHNFPAQFKNICENLAKNGHQVIFLCQTNHSNKIDSVKCIKLGVPNPSAVGKSNPHITFEPQLKTANQYKKALINLKRQGYYPDIIISHNGWGCGLYSKEIYANAKVISYSEWWFNTQCKEYFYDNNEYISYDSKKIETLFERNLPMAQEMAVADHIISPTKWQRDQLPSIFREKSRIIHDGIDTDYFVYNRQWKQSGMTNITYATRGMEPMRGFPEMIKAIKSILMTREKTTLTIAGEDKIFYGAKNPIEGSFGKWAKKILKDEINQGKVKFTGRLSLNHYARLLKISDIHLYFSRPYIASWSLIEAMSSGCCIIGSDVKPVTEILPQNYLLKTDHRSSKSIVETINNALDMTEKDREKIGLRNRRRAIDSFSKRKCLSQWTDLLWN